MRNYLVSLICFSAILFGVCEPGTATIWYVDPDNGEDTTAAYDGTSWSKSFRTISRALESVRDVDYPLLDEIWVKKTFVSVSSPIEVTKKVIIRGGFQGTEASVDQRRPGDRTTMESWSNGRCFVIEGEGTIVTLDSFLISKSELISVGGGVKVIDASLLATNCWFIDNDMGDQDMGGAIETVRENATETPRITIRHSSFSGNRAFDGGAVYTEFALVTISDSTFAGNHAVVSGGAIHSNGSQTTVEGCLLSGNTSGENGGAVSHRNERLTIEDCDIRDNRANGSGGALWLERSSTRITDSRFVENRCEGDGGAVGNTSSTSLTVVSSLFDRNHSGTDGGGIITSGAAVIRKSTFDANSADGSGGAVRIYAIDALVEDSLFDANTSLHSGGAIYMDGPVFVGDTINALDCRNCIFTKNEAFDEGGAMYLSNAKMAAANSTFYLNRSYEGTGYPFGEGATVYIDGASSPSLSTMHNCIVQAPQWASNGIVAINGAQLEVKFCCTFPVMELDEGNMTVAPPLFVDPENGDFHLPGDSPCINAGSNDLVVSALDFEGEARIVAGRVDMGALEHDDDEDGDGLPNDYEAEGCTSPYAFDTDGDGLSDFQEIFNCNQSNSIKICTDPCDADTDDDGLVDGNAGSEDLNANGIWEPELGETHPGEWDSDGDGLPDGLERGLIEPETIDTDLSAGFFVEDKDPASITDPTNPDTDGDGILDGEEDINRDGKYNPDEGETDPVNIDSDVDGALDDEDCCQNSDFRPTVVIGSCDSGVENRLVDCGCTISDRVIQCADRTKNHGQFISCVAKMTNNLRREKIITGKEKGALQSCAAKR